MDVYEATRVVLARIQSLDAENAAKIMGFILIQEHGDKEMIRLAFGPESLLHSVVLKARRELGLAAAVPSPSSSPPAAARPPFGPLARQNPPSFRFFPLSVPSSTSFAPPPVFSRSALSGSPDELHDSDELVSPVPSPFFNGGAARGEQLVEEFHIQDRVSFLDDLAYPEAGCPSPGGSGDGLLFPQSVGWGINGAHHRQSWSAGDLPLPSDAATGGFGWKPCLYFARGYCKDGHACRFLHCGLPEEAAAGARMDAAEELLFRSKSQRISGGGASELMASAFPYSPLGSLSSSPSSTTNKWFDFLLQQQQNDSQRAALIRARMERSDLAGMVNPGSRQIYLTFPADSTFTEEDVSNYFSIYGPVQDVRIPYQQKRMFGFVTFVYPETVKLILAKGNPHFVCDARVLVKPYKEKGRAPDKCRKLQQQTERLDFPGSTTPTGLESRDPYDLQQLGARMLYKNSSSQELLLRRKLEEQQQALELQQAIELQARRLMNLQLLDLKNRSLSAPACINSPTITASPAITIPTVDTSSNGSSSSSSSQEHSPTVEANPKVNSSNVSLNQKAVNSADKKESGDEAKPDEDSDFHESNSPYLPESPFASPTKSAINSSSSNNTSSNSNHLMPPTPSPALDMASYKSCFLQLPRFSSHGAIGM